MGHHEERLGLSGGHHGALQVRRAADSGPGQAGVGLIVAIIIEMRGGLGWSMNLY